MDNKVIERCVKASFECWNNHNGLSYTQEDMSDCEKQFAKKHIVEIIKAMREPTDKIIDAMIEVGPDRGPSEYWYAGIDCIINE